MAPLVAALVALFAIAGLAGAAESSTRVARPAIKVEKAGACVEPTDEMRRNHMNMLFQQRDQTVHLGLRSPRHSLKGCVDCHANPATGSVLGKDGFCESCHAYAAVKIDCFECHSSSPRRAAAGLEPIAPMKATAQ